MGYQLGIWAGTAERVQLMPPDVIVSDVIMAIVSLPSRLRLFLTVLAILFFAEAAVVLLLPWLPSRNPLATALIDSLLLTLLSAPFLWWVIVRPLRHIALVERGRAATVISNAMDGIITINEQGLVESFNPAAERLFGYGAEEVVGRPLTLLMPERYRDAYQRGLERVRSTGEARLLGRTVEFHGLRKDGREFPMELSVTSWRTGQETFYTSIVREITERKQAEETLMRQTKKLAALNAVATAVSSSLDLQEILEKALETALAVMEMEKGVIRLLDEKTGTLILAASRGLSPGYLGEARPMRVGEGFSGSIALTGEPLFVTDASQDPRLVRIVELEGVRSVAGIPLIAGDRILGTMSLNSLKPRPFSPLEAETLTAIGRQMGMAIANARLYERIKADAQFQRSAREIALALTSALDLDQVLSLVCREMVHLFQVDGAYLWILDEGAGELVGVTACGHQADLFRGMRVPLQTEGSLSVKVVKEQRGAFINRVEESELAGAYLATLFNARSLMALPLLAKGRVVGAIVLNDIHRQDRFGESILEQAELVASQAAIAIENARLHRELATYANKLERKVEERTQALQAANLRLTEALHQAEAAARAKSEFLANMSHELRTPLNAILGFSEMLQDQTFGPLNVKQARYVDNIRRSGKHLLALINDLLDLSKVEAGKLELWPEPFDLREALAAALAEIRPQAEAKRLQLQLSVDEALSLLAADPVRFRQILSNLLSNAVKFTPEGGRITVTARRVPRSEFQVQNLEPGTMDFVEIAVQDTGIGIKAEDLPRLFQPLTQLEPVFTKQYQGTGLGLALTKRLVELHGGTIWAESKGEGRGSTFTVRLPLQPS